MDEPLTLLAALALAAAHVLAPRMRFLGGLPRSAWLSAFGGISVAYVFVHLLPELAEGQRTIEEGGEGEGPLLDFLEAHVYLMALAGLALFYGIEYRSLRSRAAQRAAGGEDRTTPDALWFSLASFALYNAIIGYLLLRSEIDEAFELALYTLALGVHFVVNDFGLREHHKHDYDRVGRWILVGAILAGWLVGLATTVPERVIALVMAFLAGGIVLNVLKEELPGERQARFLPFAAGAAAYAALLQVS